MWASPSNHFAILSGQFQILPLKFILFSSKLAQTFLLCDSRRCQRCCSLMICVESTNLIHAVQACTVSSCTVILGFCHSFVWCVRLLWQTRWLWRESISDTALWQTLHEVLGSAHVTDHAGHYSTSVSLCGRLFCLSVGFAQVCLTRWSFLFLSVRTGLILHFCWGFCTFDGVFFTCYLGLPDFKKGSPSHCMVEHGI